MFTMEQFLASSGAPPADRAGVTIQNSEGLGQNRWDTGLQRPYLHKDGHVYVDVFQGYKTAQKSDGTPIYNEKTGMPKMVKHYEPQRVAERVGRGLPVVNINNATALTKDAWIRLDAQVMAAARQRLRAYADLRAANTFGGFDGMSTPILEHEIVTDPGEAIADMEGLSEGRNAAPKYALQGLPLPIVHSDFHLAQRFLATSRARGGQAQDTIRAEIAARRVAEMIEQATIGSIDIMTYGTSTDYLQTSKVYGYINHPNRITKTDLTAPTSSNGTTIVAEVLEMIEEAYTYNFYGPFMLYVSTGYDAVLDNDLKAESDKTVRQRIREIEAITDVRRLDYLTGNVMLLVQMTPDVAQAVNGMEITTVQYETKGGMQTNFKVMAIQVPRIRAVYQSGTENAYTGIVHGTTS